MNVGKPLQNTSVVVLRGEDSFDLLPLGAVGELCFGGDQVVSSLSMSSEMLSNRVDIGARIPRIPNPNQCKLHQSSTVWSNP